MSCLFFELNAELLYALGYFVGENYKPLVCRLEKGIVFNDGLRMAVFHGDRLMRRVNEIIYRVVEAGLYNYRITQKIHMYKVMVRKIAIVHPLEGY
jgi:hypothetical protein